MAQVSTLPAGGHNDVDMKTNASYKINYPWLFAEIRLRRILVEPAGNVFLHLKHTRLKLCHLAVMIGRSNTFCNYLPCCSRVNNFIHP